MAAGPHQFTTMQFKATQYDLHHSGMCANPFRGASIAHDSCKKSDDPSTWALWLPAYKIFTKRSS